MRISKKGYYDVDNLFFKLPLVCDKSKSFTGLMFAKKILSMLYVEAYDQSKNRKTFGWGSKSYEEYEA